MASERIEFMIDSVNLTWKTISILRVTINLDDEGNETGRNNHRCGFAPGQIEEVKQFLGVESSPEIDYLNAVWTAEVINAYQQMILASQQEQI